MRIEGGTPWPWIDSAQLYDEMGGTNRNGVACARLVSAPSGETISAPPARTVKRVQYSTMSSDIECDDFARVLRNSHSQSSRDGRRSPTTRQPSNLNSVIRRESAYPHPEQAFANFQPAITKKRGPRVWTNFLLVNGTARLAFYTLPQPTFLFTHTVPPLTEA
jgi:hypothetical protein